MQRIAKMSLYALCGALMFDCALTLVTIAQELRATHARRKREVWFKSFMQREQVNV